MDGKSASEIIGGNIGYTYDDIILLPRYTDVILNNIKLENHITKNIKLNIPIISSPMDTVTESLMAISMALQGGIGIIHYNCSIEEQVTMVKEVKLYKNGFITNPIVISPEKTIKPHSTVTP